MSTTDEIRRGTIQGFEGSWGSGIGYLIVKDSETGKVERLTCENAETARSLDAAFGNVIGTGHGVKEKGGHVGQEIYWSKGDWVGIGGFQPVEEASGELLDEYDADAKARKLARRKSVKIKLKKPKGWHQESARHSLARKGIKTGRKR